MRLFLLIILYVFLALFSYSQDTENNKFDYHSNSIKAEKLALRLTRHLETDSAKVYAIHNWMTHHIKYDIKKYLAYDYSRIPVYKILRKRKAICTGYSDLFSELCNYAQITSAAVSGYIKNEDYDLNDKFYLDEHVWNAVYINHEWKLIDVCWDAGYIAYYKRTITGHIIHFLTLGKCDIIKYKPHFIHSPRETYFYKSGNFFITDHISSNPIWQFINPQKTIEQMETDSSFYLGRYDSSPLPYNSNYLDGERFRIAGMKPEERDIADGFSTYNYNHKNHYSIGKSYFYLANEAFDKIDSKTTDTLKILRQCDSIDEKINQSIMHYDSNAFFLAKQKTELSKNNLKKRSILTEQNKLLITSTKAAAKNIVLGKHLGILGKGIPKTISRRSQQQLKRLISRKTFYRTNQAEKPNQIDSTESSQRIILLLDSLNKMELSINEKFEYLDSLHIICLNKINQYSNHSALNKSTDGLICLERIFYEDDLDYNIRTMKDTLLKHKFSDDSLLIERNKGFIVKIFYTEFSKLKKNFNNFYRCHKALADEYTILKKSCVIQNDLSVQYEKGLDLYSKEVMENVKVIGTYRKKFDEIKNICKRQIKPTRKEKKEYINERRVESKMFPVRLNYINKHYSALTIVNRRQLGYSKKIQNAIKKLRNKYIPK
jgi:hypothetical protein